MSPKPESGGPFGQRSTGPGPANRSSTASSPSVHQHPEARNAATQANLGSGVQNNTFYGGKPPDRRLLPSLTPPYGQLTTQTHGRDRLIQQLVAVHDQHSASVKVIVLHGVGGVGKSRLALELASQAARKPSALRGPGLHRGQPVGAGTNAQGLGDSRGSPAQCWVWWVRAADAAALTDGMTAVAYAAGAAPESFDRASPADVLWDSLNALRDRWMLIIDNADDPSLFEGQGAIADGNGWLRPPAADAQGLILLTSREGRPDRWAPWVQITALDPLVPDDAAAVLRDLAPAAGDQAQAIDLGSALSGIPLLLHLAGRTLAENASDAGLPTGWIDNTTEILATFADYQQAFERHAYDPANSTDDAVRTDLDHLYQRSWQISIGQLETAGMRDARNLLLLLCCFGDGPLPYGDVLAPGSLAATEMFAGITGRGLLRALHVLVAQGLATLSTDSATIRIHPVIRTTTRTHPDLTTDVYWRLATQLLLDTASHLLGPTTADGSGGATDVVAWSQLSAHIGAAFGQIDSLEGADLTFLPWRLYVLREGADRLRDYGLHAQALAIYDVLVRIDPEPNGYTRHDRARTLRDMGRHDEALAEFDTILATYRAQHGEDHQYTLIARHDRASTLREMGRHAEALAEFDTILATYRAQHGEDHPDTLIARHDRARTLRVMGRHDEARAEFDTILATDRAQHGEDHRYTLTTRYDRARTLQNMGRHDEALAEFDTILATYRAQHGDDHPDTLMARHNRARTLRDMGRHDEALAEFDTILATYRAQHGEDHHYTLIARHDRARTLRDMGRHAEALAEFDTTVASTRAQHGEDHADTLTARHDRAATLVALGRNVEAGEELQEVHERRSSLLGPEHWRTKESAHLLAGLSL